MVPSFATAMLPANIVLVTPAALTRRLPLLVSTDESSTFTANACEDKVNPSPATAVFKRKPVEFSIADVPDNWTADPLTLLAVERVASLVSAMEAFDLILALTRFVTVLLSASILLLVNVAAKPFIVNVSLPVNKGNVTVLSAANAPTPKIYLLVALLSPI